MKAEMAEGADAFARAVTQDVPEMPMPSAIYTFARGSSDTVANVLSYAFMDRLGIPMTSLPPSVFSLGGAVAFPGAMALVISQSGGSDDLVACAKATAQTVAITNVAGSPVETHATLTIPVMAGVENAIPATKTVIGSIGAGMALLAALDPDFRASCTADAQTFATLGHLPNADALADTLAKAQHLYVIGRGTSFGAAQEIALKLKETAAIHAESYSASEVLHGPLQLSAKPLTVFILDAGGPAEQPSLNAAEARFRAEGATVLRVKPPTHMSPPAQAAALLYLLYPVVHRVALSLGCDPDAPPTLKKVTRTT